MYKSILIILMFLPISALANTDWSRVAANTALIADWGQTRNIAMDNSYTESNPLLGERPTLSKVNKHFLIALIGINLIGENISPKYRNTFYWGVAGVETAYVMHNFNAGLTIKF